MAEKALKTRCNKAINLDYWETKKITLMGFSTEGIVAGYYLQRLERYKRIRGLFSIPLLPHGSYLA